MIISVAAAMITVGGVMLIRHKKRTLAQAPKYGMRPTPVCVASARLGYLRETRDYLAVVEPFRTANVSARLTATVEKVLYDENEPVGAGDILVMLDGRQIEDSIGAMKAQIAQAQADMASSQVTVESLEKSVAYWRREGERHQSLYEKKVVSRAQAEATADRLNEFEGKLNAARQKTLAIQHRIESLKRKRTELETRLSYCTVRSPFDGLVSHRMVDPGDLAVPGKTLMVVEDRSSLKLSFDVPQQDLPQVREGLKSVYPVAGEKRTAVLSHLFPSLNAARMLRAEVCLGESDPEGLCCGAYVPLQVVLNTKTGVTFVPATSIVESHKRAPYVFVVNDARLHPRAVSILGTDGDDVAVEGVRADEQVVVSTFLGWARLSSGLKVEAIK